MLEVTPRWGRRSGGSKRRDEGRGGQVVRVVQRGAAGEVSVDGLHVAVEQATEPSRIMSEAARSSRSSVGLSAVVSISIRTFPRDADWFSFD